MVEKTLFVFVIFAFVLVKPVSSCQNSSSDATRTGEKRLLTTLSNWLFGRPFIRQFFLGKQAPQGLPANGVNAGTEILQYLPGGDGPFFATLFDDANNIPFYSAYVVTPAQTANIGAVSGRTIRSNAKWRAPPGVSNLDKDYKSAINAGMKISRGHMNPLGINTFDANYARSTFTLTNAVPQYEASNSGPWQMFEERIKKYVQNVCGIAAQGGTLYLLTGTSNVGLKVAPADGRIPDNSHWPDPAALPKPPATNNVAIPRSIWTAGCCVWQEGKIPLVTKTYFAESFAVMTNNRDNQAQLLQKEMTLAQLETLLTLPGAPTVNLFPGDLNCRLRNVIIPP